jgi:lysophospholipase L1-like esterase
MRLALLLCVLSAGPLSRQGAATAADKPFRVVCFGDSITGDRPRKPYLHQYLKFSDLLQLILETHLGAGRAEVLNRGWGGDTALGLKSGDSPGALNRLDKDVLDEKPDIAVILFGGNDAGFANRGDQATKEARVAEFRRNVQAKLTEMVTRCKAAGIRVLLLQYHRPKAADMSRVWAHLDDFNDVIARVAREQDVPTVEMAPVFEEAAKTRPQERLTNTVDGVHLNPYGEVLYARAIFEALRAQGWIPGLGKRE